MGVLVITKIIHISLKQHIVKTVIHFVHVVSNHILEQANTEGIIPFGCFDIYYGDFPKIALLLLLYCLQGIPLGLVAAIPFLLQVKSGFTGQAMFSLATWPFATKVLLAPIVDSISIAGMGPRKSWLILSQLGIALVMYYSKSTIDINFERNHTVKLTFIFLLLCLFASIQDIAVDGWAVTMLKSENINWASTCNTVGQAIGLFIGNSCFLALNSSSFCNYYLHSPQLLTLSSLFAILGPIYLFISIIIAVITKENHMTSNESSKAKNLLIAYQSLIAISMTPSLKSLATIHLTSKIAFAAMDNLFILELGERGVSQDIIAFLSTFLFSPMQILFPLILTGNFFKFKSLLHPRKPLYLYIKAYKLRLILAALHIPIFLLHDHSFMYRKIHIDSSITMLSLPWSMIFILSLYFFYRVSECAMFISQMAFHAHISEKRHLSGTYMTLTNSLANAGVQLCSTPTMKLAELFDSIKVCTASYTFTCKNAQYAQKCLDSGGVCNAFVDPFYIISFTSTIYGIRWYLDRKEKIIDLQNYSHDKWSCENTRENSNKQFLNYF
ncbi:hypothetical protein GJ496_011516 [Pomphorhynchus laevis]|nr:hypothetical protein GJ496_011516 [Pomphorhynchus laevis]